MWRGQDVIGREGRGCDVHVTGGEGGMKGKVSIYFK